MLVSSFRLKGSSDSIGGGGSGGGEKFHFGEGLDLLEVLRPAKVARGGLAIEELVQVGGGHEETARCRSGGYGDSDTFGFSEEFN